MNPEPAEPLWLRVTDVKQWLYCPRLVHFFYCQPVQRPVTYKMQEGKLQGTRVEELEQRRSLYAYGLVDGERHFGVALESWRLGLTGRLDMVIRTPSELIPVDFKHTEGGVARNHRYQLTAYALLLEEQWGTRVARGFIYLILERRAVEVRITAALRREVERALTAMRSMLRAERFPEPTPRRARHRDCEYRHFCNDVDW